VRLALVTMQLACAVLWLGVLVASPWLAVHARPRDASYVAAGLVYRAGSVVCHQQPGRSFHIDGAQLPVCARCTGLYAGVPLGTLVVLAAWARGRSGYPIRAVRLALAAGAVPPLVLWGAGHAGGIAVSNWMRAAGAVPLGAVIAWVAAAFLAGRPMRDSARESGVN
jgi:uncharacterized membrane protein